MNWVRLNYDRVALGVAALFLAGCALFVYLDASHFDDTFAPIKTTPPPNSTLPPPKAPEVEQVATRLRQPAQWTTSTASGLFVPEKHFIGASGQPETLKTMVVHPPVPNEWFEQFGLPVAEADVLTQDPDGDGFTNLDEWEGHTNPTEKESHPAYLTKLKMKAFVQKPFRLIFSSSMGDTFAINTVDLRQPTQFLKVGDMITNTKFKIIGYAEKFDVDKYGTKIDVSELTIENQESKEQLNLVKEKTINSPESFAQMIYLWGQKREFPLKKEQEFSLPPEEQIKYKLLDVQPDHATIVNLQKPNEKIEIGLLKP